MKNSILTKQIFIYISTLFISFIIFAGVLTLAYSNYYTNLKEKQLIGYGKKLSEEIYEQYAINLFTDNVESDELKHQFQFMEEYLNSSVL